MSDASTTPTSQTWGYAAIASVATYVLALVLVLPRLSRRNDASVAGELLVYALFGFVAGGFLGTTIQARWRVVIPCLAPPLVATVLMVFTQGSHLLDEHNERSESAANYARSHLASPNSVIGWKQVFDPAAQRQAETAADALKTRDPNASVVYGSYARGPKAMTFVGTTTGANSGMRDELEQSPRKAVINLMAGAGLSDPSSVPTVIEGIELFCADFDVSTVVCSWADLTAVGTVKWRVEGIDVDQASALTERFLEEIRIVDELPE